MCKARGIDKRDEIYSILDIYGNKLNYLAAKILLSHEYFDLSVDF